MEHSNIRKTHLMEPITKKMICHKNMIDIKLQNRTIDDDASEKRIACDWPSARAIDVIVVRTAL